jgi:hypothetical protein
LRLAGNTTSVKPTFFWSWRKIIPNVSVCAPATDELTNDLRILMPFAKAMTWFSPAGERNQSPDFGVLAGLLSVFAGADLVSPEDLVSDDFLSLLAAGAVSFLAPAL